MRKVLFGLLLLSATQQAISQTQLLARDAGYQHMESFKEDRAAVTRNNKKGFIDKTGKEVIPCKYDVAYDFYQGFAVVVLRDRPGVNEKYGHINSSGKEITPIQYDFATDFSHGMAAVQLHGKWGFVDTTGKEVIPLQYESISDFESAGVTTAKEKEDWFVIDKKNHKRIDLTDVTSASGFIEGLARITLFWKDGFIDPEGVFFVQPKYDRAHYFQDGMAKVEKDGKLGFINKTGEEVVPLQYSDAAYFSDGLAAVAIDGKYGFVDTSGRVVIPLQYADVHDFRNGLARVRMNHQSKWACIDVTGKEIIPPIYDVIKIGEGILTVSQNGVWQFLDLRGKALFPEKYENAYPFSDGVALVRQHGNWFYIDKAGKRLF